MFVKPNKLFIKLSFKIIVISRKFSRLLVLSSIVNCNLCGMNWMFLKRLWTSRKKSLTRHRLLKKKILCIFICEFYFFIIYTLFILWQLLMIGPNMRSKQIWIINKSYLKKKNLLIDYRVWLSISSFPLFVMKKNVFLFEVLRYFARSKKELNINTDEWKIKVYCFSFCSYTIILPHFLIKQNSCSGSICRYIKIVIYWI